MFSASYSGCDPEETFHRSHPAGNKSLLLSRERQSETKSRAAADLILSPNLTAVYLDDGSRDRQYHPHSLLLGGEERIKNFLQLVRRNARSRVGNGRFRKIF